MPVSAIPGCFVRLGLHSSDFSQLLVGYAGSLDHCREVIEMRFSLFHDVETRNEGVESAEFVAKCAVAAEQSGFDAIAFSEHPAPSLKWLNHGGHESFDPFVALAYCAGITTRLRLMPCLAVLPYRNPLHVAKTLASLDVLSNGRLTLVAGAGYLRSEFKALGVDFAERNALLDESLEVLNKIWSNSEFTFEGRHFTALGQVSRPQPLQNPVPILIGGNSQAARKRAVRFASGWAPIQIKALAAETTRTSPLETLDDVKVAVSAMRTMVSESGRDNNSFVIQLDARATDFVDSDQPIGERLEELRTLSEIGIDRCAVHIPVSGISETLETIDMIGSEVIKRFSSESR
jgi:probable F420-dependent oxidoreductase